MKKLNIVALFSAIIAFLVFSAFSSDRLFEITAGSGYSYAYSDESKSQIAEKLNLTENDLDTFCENNNIEYLAVSEDNKSQIRVSVYEDDFSKKTDNLSAYSEKDVKKLAKKLVQERPLSYAVYIRNARKYIKITESLSDSGGSFTATQYITVAGGKTYNITFCNADSKTDGNSEKILDTFEIKEENEKSKTPVLFTILVAIGVAAFAAVIVAMIVGIFKDKRKSESKEKEIENIQ